MNMHMGGCELDWVHHFARPVNKDPIDLDSCSVTVQGEGANRLWINIVRVDNRYEQYRPKFSEGKTHLLVINCHDVFAGSKEECMDEAARRADSFTGEFLGYFSLDLLEPGSMAPTAD